MFKRITAAYEKAMNPGAGDDFNDDDFSVGARFLLPLPLLLP